MSKHDHLPPLPSCAHELSMMRYCAKCDVWECLNCGEEWVKLPKVKEMEKYKEIVKKANHEWQPKWVDSTVYCGGACNN